MWLRIQSQGRESPARELTMPSRSGVEVRLVIPIAFSQIVCSCEQDFSGSSKMARRQSHSMPQLCRAFLEPSLVSPLFCALPRCFRVGSVSRKLLISQCIPRRCERRNRGDTGLLAKLLAAHSDAVGQSLIENGATVCGPTGNTTDDKKKELNKNKNRTDIKFANCRCEWAKRSIAAIV